MVSSFYRQNNWVGFHYSVCLFFNQKNTNISQYFLNNNDDISELLNIQLFYFKFTDIYKLLASKFKRNEKWNNFLEIKQEKLSGDLCCFYTFLNENSNLELALISKYDPKNRKYNFNIFNSGMFYELTKEQVKFVCDEITNFYLHH